MIDDPSARLADLAHEYRRLGLLRVRPTHRPSEISEEDWAFILNNLKTFRMMVGDEIQQTSVSLWHMPWIKQLQIQLIDDMAERGWRTMNITALVEYALKYQAVRFGLLPELKPHHLKKQTPPKSKWDRRFGRKMRDW